MIRPQFIYKYYSITEYTLDAIQNNYFWFCDIEKLNDPFDSQYLFSEKYIDKWHIPQNLKVDFTKMFLWGVCCFTVDNDNILMWSHYANNHSGICIKFDTTKDKLLSEKLFPIIYTNKKPVINNSEEIVKKGMLRKKKSWEYEKEWRLISASDMKMEYNPEALVCIYIGAKVKKQDEELLMDCIKGIRHIDVKRSKINILTQRVEFDNIVR